ncbi:MAG: DUF4037 domain-containing protein [Chloroflexi bacterium]|nr:DUF4037 domain-containing protein [Chloroflexota bacterium]
MPEFIPGLELSRLFYVEAVKPILDAQFPDLRYDAGLIETGSEVLGFDTPMSRDHHWGPRVTLYVSADDYPKVAEAIKTTMREKLPYKIHGYSTSFAPIPDEPHILRFEERSEGGVNHRVYVMRLRDYINDYLGFDLNDEITPADWLTFPQQKLRTITSGAVYHSGLGELDALRARLHYYPRDVWLYLMACQWMRISQEEPFVGRAGDVGDDLGSRVIAARLVRDVMLLCFLMERVYAPYPKWFGTGFSKLKCALELNTIFQPVFSAEHWRERQTMLGSVYNYVAEMHNALGITEPLPTIPSSFHERPYTVIHGEVFAEALRALITDPEVKRIADKSWIGSIDQFSDSTDLRENTSLREGLTRLYR